MKLRVVALVVAALALIIVVAALVAALLRSINIAGCSGCKTYATACVTTSGTTIYYAASVAGCNGVTVKIYNCGECGTVARIAPAGLS